MAEKKTVTVNDVIYESGELGFLQTAAEDTHEPGDRNLSNIEKIDDDDHALVHCLWYS